MKILDNVLEQARFNGFQHLMISKDFPWYYRDWVDYVVTTDKFMFCHVFYYDGVPCSKYFKFIEPILELIKPISIFRIKANLLTKTPNIVENAFHVDMPDISEEKQKQWTTSIFYMNTNNGYTKFEDGTIVESVTNRLVTFPANLKHTGTSCTDKKTRIVINFNYLDNGDGKV